ncbi:MAG: hypothetical protein WCA56_17900, partial [Xanthobacteraceae bacterium]
RRLRAGHETLRLPAFRFPSFFFVARMKRSEIRERHKSSSIGPGLRSAPSGLRRLREPQFNMDHRVKPGGDEESEFAV